MEFQKSWAVLLPSVCLILGESPDSLRRSTPIWA